MISAPDFVEAFAGKGLLAWERAAIELGKSGELTPWPMVELALQDDRGNEAILKVDADVVSVGQVGAAMRLPLTPEAGQAILNVEDKLFPTPWIVYQLYRAAPFKIAPVTQLPTANLRDYARHSSAVDAALRGVGWTPGELASGTKKNVIVSNIHQTGKVLIYGWYKPAPDVFDDRKKWFDPTRQPRQVRSNAHYSTYVDYSHGIQGVAGVATVNGAPMRTEELYRHPTLSRLVSDEGALAFVRYPAPVPPRSAPPAPLVPPGATFVPTEPTGGLAALGLATLARPRSRS